MPSENKTTNIGLNQWQGNENLRRQDLVDDNAAIDAVIGNRTIDDTKIPNANNSTSLSTLLSWLGSMIKSITGKTSWRTAPVKSIEQLNNDVVTHSADNTAHGVGNKVDKSLATAADQFMVSSGAGAWIVKTVAQVKTLLGLGDAAYKNTGTASGTVAAGDHTHSAYIPHSLATAANDFLVASGAGAFVKKTLAEIKTILGLGSAAYTNSTAYATAAQGTKADNAMPIAGGTYTGIVSHGRQLVQQQQLKDYSEKVGVGTLYGAGIFDLSTGNVFDIQVNGAATVSFTNSAPAGQASSLTIILKLAAGIGPYAITWPTSVIWNGGTAPTFNTGKTAILNFYTVDGGSHWYGSLAGNNYTSY